MDRGWGKLDRVRDIETIIALGKVEKFETKIEIKTKKINAGKLDKTEFC